MFIFNISKKERQRLQIDKYEYSNIDIPEFTDSFEYSSDQPELTDFSAWLTKYLATEKFKQLSAKFIDLNKRIKTERDNETRSYLIRQSRQLEDEA